VQYAIAGILLAIGVVLWVVTVMVMRSQGLKPSGDELPPISHTGPVN
jgi:APA family basic amino acid/polyamine antiporter